MRSRAGLALTLAAGLGGPAAADECRLALLLALDVSSSVDAGEDALQRGGLAAALVAPEVQRAFFAAPAPVAIAIYEWSGRYNQEILVDWRLVREARDLAEIAATVRASRRSYAEFPTAMGYALGFGAGMLRDAPRCVQQTIDMAGDGVNNEGFPPAAAYAEFPFDEVIVNGLVIVSDAEDEDGDLVAFYRNQVLHGPGAFLEIAVGFEDYERAMRRKLEREVTPRAVGALPGGDRPG